MSAPVRVGVVSYLNAKPLYFRLENRLPRCRSRWTCRAGWPIVAAGGTGYCLDSIRRVFQGCRAGLGYEVLPGFAIARGAGPEREAFVAGFVRPDSSGSRSMQARARARR